ncbi:hypothetical protein P5673_022648 [Acropora cervicornis]|uniref:Uncharacterized protein n=1 Tax=Acropora cervicornis TaxID=6130 RepID=A0AAD9Q6J6_ACRCE|nr:hypothetical protein P5673_022648 [Acropora cervicornis]
MYNALEMLYLSYCINFHIPKPRTEFGKGSIQYRVAVLWNIISAVFRTQLTLSDFKPLVNGKIDIAD